MWEQLCYKVRSVILNCLACVGYLPISAKCTQSATAKITLLKKTDQKADLQISVAKTDTYKIKKIHP